MIRYQTVSITTQTDGEEEQNPLAGLPGRHELR